MFRVQENVFASSFILFTPFSLSISLFLFVCNSRWEGGIWPPFPLYLRQRLITRRVWMLKISSKNSRKNDVDLRSKNGRVILTSQKKPYLFANSVTLYSVWNLYNKFEGLNIFWVLKSDNLSAFCCCFIKINSFGLTIGKLKLGCVTWLK